MERFDRRVQTDETKPNVSGEMEARGIHWIHDAVFSEGKRIDSEVEWNLQGFTKISYLNRMSTYWYKPAFYAHILSTIAMIFALVLFVMNYQKILRMNPIELIKIASLIAIAIASHGQSHMYLEKEYGYDPVRSILG